MTTRAQLDAELDHLQSMLPAWQESLRHEAQFWPQFTALSEEILARADPADRDYARQRIEAMRAMPSASPLPLRERVAEGRERVSRSQGQ